MSSYDQKPAEEKPIEKMTVVELREIAKKIPDISGVHAMKKEELLTIISKSKGIALSEKTKKTVPNKKTVKEKIKKIKQLKEEARKSKDKRKIKFLRKRLSRFKKRSRKAA